MLLWSGPIGRGRWPLLWTWSELARRPARLARRAFGSRGAATHLGELELDDKFVVHNERVHILDDVGVLQILENVHFSHHPLEVLDVLNMSLVCDDARGERGRRSV